MHAVVMKKLFSTLLLIGFFTPCFSQADTLPAPELCFTALIVRNIDSSIVWYSEKLGFAALNQATYHAGDFKLANLQRGGIQIELIEIKSTLFPDEVLNKDPYYTRIGGFFKVGFLVADFDQWVKFLQQTKTEFRGGVVSDPVSGRRTFLVKDPDGNQIQFFEK